MIIGGVVVGDRASSLKEEVSEKFLALVAESSVNGPHTPSLTLSLNAFSTQSLHFTHVL